MSKLVGSGRLGGYEHVMSMLAPPSKIESLFDKNKTKLSTYVDKVVDKLKAANSLKIAF